MSCKNCADCGCKKCNTRYGKAAASAGALQGQLKDGTYDNATVTIRGGKVTAVQRGKTTFHSFTDPCALNVLPDGEDPAGAGVVAAGFFLQNSTCILVEGVGTSASPASLKLNLNPEQFQCTQTGLALKPPTVPGVSQNLCDFEVLAGRVTKLPTAIVTSVESLTPDTLTAEISNCKLKLGLVDGGVLGGTTLYTTFVRGTCNGPYPIWVVKTGDTYAVNIGYTITGAAAAQGASASFPMLAAAIAAADSYAAQPVNDCVVTPP